MFLIVLIYNDIELPLKGTQKMGYTLAMIHRTEETEDTRILKLHF